MAQDFQPGDYLIFQIESGYGLLRVLGSEDSPEGPVWHVSAYDDLFMDVEGADSALEAPETLSISLPHVALTNRAFESTQVARMGNVPLTHEDNELVEKWASDPDRVIHDRSIRLLLGLR